MAASTEGIKSRQRLTEDSAPSTKFSEGAAASIIAALKNGNSRPSSAAAGGIAVATFRDWLARYEKFKQQVFEAESYAERAHVSVINKAAARGVWQASAWWLERTRPDVFGKVDRVEVMLRQRQAENLAGELAAEGIQVSATEIQREAESLRKRAARAAGALPPGPPRKGQRIDAVINADVAITEGDYTEVE
jgi:hypothetical protein